MVFRNPPPAGIISITQSSSFGTPGNPAFGAGFWGPNDLGFAQPGMVIDSTGMCNLQGTMKALFASGVGNIAINNLPTPFDGLSHDGLIVWELSGTTARRVDLVFETGGVGWSLIMQNAWGAGTYLTLDAISYYVGGV